MAPILYRTVCRVPSVERLMVRLFCNLHLQLHHLRLYLGTRRHRFTGEAAKHLQDAIIEGKKTEYPDDGNRARLSILRKKKPVSRPSFLVVAKKSVSPFSPLNG